MSVYDGVFGGWGRERSVKQHATGVSLWWGWTSTVSVYKSSSQSIAAVRSVGMTVESHPSPTAPEVNIKTFPSPPHYPKNRRLYRGTCFRKFSKLLRTKIQNVKTEVLGFVTSGKGVNTRTNNLRVHTADFDTGTTSIRITACSGWLEWRSHGCPKVMSTTNIYYSTKLFTFICKWIRVRANGFKTHTKISVYMCQNKLIMWSLLKPQPTKQELWPKTIELPISLIVQHHNKIHHKSKWQLFSSRKWLKFA